MSNKIELNFTEFAGLQTGRIARIHCGRASIEVAGRGQDARFVMEGPSGVHTLLVDATDFERLNAHWTAFASHELNKLAA